MADSGDLKSLLSNDCPVLLPLLASRPEIQIYTKSHTGYQKVVKTFDTLHTTQPKAFIVVHNDGDVSAAVKVLSAAKMPFSVRGQGHDFYGRALVPDGIIIDLRQLDSISIAADRHTAVIGGGISLSQVQATLDQNELITPGGLCSAVGYTGWACGGGYGSLSAKWGLGADNIVNARLVLTSGALIDTSDGEHDELLWAIRGAGNGTFGIITQLTIKVYPRPDFLGGFVAFPISEAEGVLGGLAMLLEETKFPREFGGDAIYASVNGSSVLNFIFTWAAGESETGLERGKAFLNRFRALGTALVDTVGEITYHKLMEAFGERANIAVAYHIQPRVVAALSPSVGRILQEHLVPTANSCIVIHNMHGKMTEPNPGSSFANRTDHVVLALSGAGPPGCSWDSEDMQIGRQWVGKLAKAIDDEGLALQRGYASFTRTEDTDLEVFYGIETLERLRKVKETYDPSKLMCGGYPEL